MGIDLQTKIAALLDEYPQLEGALMELSPAFSKLQNPVLRRTVAKVATLQQAAQIAGISPAEMVQTLRKAAGLIDKEVDSMDRDSESEPQPNWFDENKITIRFDARPMLDAGNSPMQEILRISKILGSGDILELKAPFKPIPIMDLLVSKGFDAWYSDGKAYFIKSRR